MPALTLLGVKVDRRIIDAVVEECSLTIFVLRRRTVEVVEVLENRRGSLNVPFGTSRAGACASGEMETARDEDARRGLRYFGERWSFRIC